MSAAASANWAANFVVTISFLTLLSAITVPGTFFLSAFLTLVAIAYFWRRVPETRGMRLEEISGPAAGAVRSPELARAAGRAVRCFIPPGHGPRRRRPLPPAAGTG